MANLFALLRNQPVSACMNVHAATTAPMASKSMPEVRSTARESVQERHLIQGRREERVFVRAMKETAFNQNDLDSNLSDLL